MRQNNLKTLCTIKLKFVDLLKWNKILEKMKKVNPSNEEKEILNKYRNLLRVCNERTSKETKTFKGLNLILGPCVMI